MEREEHQMTGRRATAELRSKGRLWDRSVARRPRRLTIEPGQMLLHYRLVEKIGEGGRRCTGRPSQTECAER